MMAEKYKKNPITENQNHAFLLKHLIHPENKNQKQKFPCQETPQKPYKGIRYCKQLNTKHSAT